MDEINIVYTTSNDYAVMAGVSILSLFENNKCCDKLNVYVLADNISHENQEKISDIGKKYKRNVYFIDIVQFVEDLRKRGINEYNSVGGGYMSYAKLFIPDLMADKNRIIYIDSDTLVIDDITELARIDMQGKPIGLACDCCQNKYKRVISLCENEEYYNTGGVVVFDINQWKQKKCLEKIIWHITNVRKDYPLVEQDLINIVLHEDIFRLTMKYNYLSQYFLYPYSGLKKVYDLVDDCFYTKDEYVDADQAVVLHFCGQTFIRPWYRNSKHPAKGRYDKYYFMSPWAEYQQKSFKWSKPYFFQYLLWKHAPMPVAVLLGKIMQRIFIKLTYGV